METGNTIKGTSQVNLMHLVQAKLPNLYRDLGQNYNESEASYMSERIASLCASDLKIRSCDVSIIGKAFDKLLMTPNSTFKISPKMILTEISLMAIELDNEKRNNFTVNRDKENAQLRNESFESANTPVSRAALWKLYKMVDGYDLRGEDVDKTTGELVKRELITIEEVVRCFEEKLNPDVVFSEILDRCPKDKRFKGRFRSQRL